MTACTCLYDGFEHLPTCPHAADPLPADAGLVPLPMQATEAMKAAVSRILNPHAAGVVWEEMVRTFIWGSPMTSPEATRGRYAIEQRLRMIDFLLHQYGAINRSALEFFFGISTAQASKDFREYMNLVPENCRYNSTLKHYERTEAFRLVFS